MSPENISKLNELKRSLKWLDNERDKIWNLKFKDFEDLRFSIEYYDERWFEADSLYTDLRREMVKDCIEKIKSGEIKPKFDLNDELGIDGQAHDWVDDYLWGEREKLYYHLDELEYFKGKK